MTLLFPTHNAALKEFLGIYPPPTSVLKTSRALARGSTRFNLRGPLAPGTDVRSIVPDYCVSACARALFKNFFQQMFVIAVDSVFDLQKTLQKTSLD